MSSILSMDICVCFLPRKRKPEKKETHTKKVFFLRRELSLKKIKSESDQKQCAFLMCANSSICLIERVVVVLIVVVVVFVDIAFRWTLVYLCVPFRYGDEKHHVHDHDNILYAPNMVRDDGDIRQMPNNVCPFVRHTEWAQQTIIAAYMVFQISDERSRKKTHTKKISAVLLPMISILCALLCVFTGLNLSFCCYIVATFRSFNEIQNGFSLYGQFSNILCYSLQFFLPLTHSTCLLGMGNRMRHGKKIKFLMERIELI